MGEGFDFLDGDFLSNFFSDEPKDFLYCGRSGKKGPRSFFVWQQKNGELILVRKMKTDHIHNCMNMICRYFKKVRDYKKPLTGEEKKMVKENLELAEMWIAAFKSELDRRAENSFSLRSIWKGCFRVTK